MRKEKEIGPITPIEQSLVLFNYCENINNVNNKITKSTLKVYKI